LIHTETKGELCSDYYYANENPEIFIRKYVGDYEDEESSINSVWQIESESYEEKGASISVPSENSKKCFLRHFLTGAVIAITDGFCGY
jgi:hypothetical protein